MSGPGTTVHVYVCSSPDDMRAERACLHAEVFPALRARFSPQRITIAAPHSRQDGHPSRPAEAALLPWAALDEIDRCRPFFLALLGGRYGVPDGPIPEDALARHPWLCGCENLSLLHLEILHGLLHAPGPTNCGFCYVRRPDFLGEVPEERRADFVEVGPGADLLARLKRAIGVSGRLVREYVCHWDRAAGAVGGLAEFRLRVEAELTGALTEFLAAKGLVAEPAGDARLAELRPVYDAVHRLRAERDELLTAEQAGAAYQSLVADLTRPLDELRQRKETLEAEWRKLTRGSPPAETAGDPWPPPWRADVPQPARAPTGAQRPPPAPRPRPED